jgi:hypothetical protein
MAAQNDTLKDRLSRYREINISVTGRKSGRTISIPVWFVLEGGKLYLLQVQGSAECECQISDQGNARSQRSA